MKRQKTCVVNAAREASSILGYSNRTVRTLKKQFGENEGMLNERKQPPLPTRPPIQDIATWVETFSLMAALLATRFTEKPPELLVHTQELLAYQVSIVGAERSFEDRRWVTYNSCYQWEALASRTWTGRSQTNASTTRHSLAMPELSPGQVVILPPGP